MSDSTEKYYIEVVVNDGDAKVRIVDLDNALGKVGQTAAAASAPVYTLEQALARARAAADAASSSADAVSGALTRTQSASTAAAASGDQVQTMLAGVGREAVQAIPPITTLGTAASTTATQMTTLGTAATTTEGKVVALTSATTTANTTAGSGLASWGTLNTVLAGLGLTAGVGVAALLSFGRAAAQNADVLVKMSDKTGIGIEALQRFQAVGDASGNSIEQISSGVNRLQKALGEGSTQTLSAISALGLSLDTLRTMSPERQLAAIATAIQGIHDPARQAQLAMELFGRSGAELLPTLKADIQGISDAAWTMSAESAKALDAAGDAWKKFKRDTQAIAGEFLGNLILQLTVTGGIVSNLQLQLIELAKTTDAFRKRPEDKIQVGKPFNVELPDTSETRLREFGLSITDIQKRIDAALKPAQDFQKAVEALQNTLSGSALLTKAREYEIVLQNIGGASALTSKEVDTVVAAYTAVIEKYGQLGPSGEATVQHFQQLLAAIKPMAGTTGDLTAALQKAGAEIAALSADQFQQLTDAVHSGVFTMKQLEQASGLSETAMKLFKDQVRDTDAELRAAQTGLDGYNKKIGQLLGGLIAAAANDASITQIKARFGTMLKDVEAFAATEGKVLPEIIANALLSVVISDAMTQEEKQWAEHLKRMNAEQKKSLELNDKYLIESLAVQIKVLEDTAKATAKADKEALSAQIAHEEATSYTTKGALDLRRQLYASEYAEELRLNQQKADAELAKIKTTGEDRIAAEAAINAALAAEDAEALAKYLGNLQKTQDGTHFWSQRAVTDVQEVTNALQSLAASSGSAAGDIIFDLAAIGQAMQTAMKAGDSFAKGDYLAFAAQSFTAVNQATNSPSTSHNILGGAATGATLGFAVAGPYGAVAGAVIGAIVGWLKSSANKAVMAEVGRDWGVTITKAMADQIKADSTNLFGGSRQAAEIFDMSKIIEAAGGLNTSNLSQFTGKLRDVFVMLQTGAFTSAQAVKVLNDNWNTFVEAGTDGAGRLDPKLKEIIALYRESGLTVKALDDYIKAQVGTAITATNTIIASLGDQQTAWDTLKKTIDDLTQAQIDLAASSGNSAAKQLQAAQNATKLHDAYKAQADAASGAKDQLRDLGIIAVATFGAALKSGMSFFDALKAAAPGLDQLNQAYDALGITAEDAGTRELLLQAAILKNNPALVGGVSALGAAMVALDNIGGLNVDTFAAMQRTGSAMYTRLQGEVARLGGSTKDALLPMQAYLHNAENEAKLLKIPLDANTADMIEQSKQLGIWKDQGKSPTELLTEGMNNIVTELDKIVTRMDTIIKKTIPDKTYTVTAVLKTDDQTTTTGPGGAGRNSGGSGRTDGTPNLSALVAASLAIPVPTARVLPFVLPAAQPAARATGAFSAAMLADLTPAVAQTRQTAPAPATAPSTGGIVINIDRPILKDRQSIKELADQIKVHLDTKYRMTRKVGRG